MKYDVAVIGAGPAGSTAARVAADGGAKVIIFEREQNLGANKGCAGGLTAAALKKANLDGDVIERYIDGICMYYNRKLTMKHALRQKGATVLREKFDTCLADRAVESGAKLLKGTVVDGLAVENSGATLRANGKTYKADIVIGSDGPVSITAKNTGIRERWSARETAVLLSREIRLDEWQMNKWGNSMHMFFGNLTKNNGYAWVFPKRDTVNVGLGIIGMYGGCDLKHQLGLFEKGLGLHGKVVKELGGILPMCGPIKKPYSDRVMLVGDSAGDVGPLGGEGIYYAMEAGEIVGKVAASAVELSEFGEEKMGEYNKEFKKRLSFAYKLEKSLKLVFTHKLFLMTGLQMLRLCGPVINDWWEGYRDIKPNGLKVPWRRSPP